MTSNGTQPIGDEDSTAGHDVVDFAGRDPWSARAWLVVTVSLAVLLGGGWLVEQRLRTTEESALSTCESEAKESLERADARFSYMANYLRPALLAVPDAGRDSLFALMAEAADSRRVDVRAALGTCADVTPVWFHPGLRSRRDDLVTVLTHHVALLDAIALDGRAYYRDTPELDEERARVFGEAG